MDAANIKEDKRFAKHTGQRQLSDVAKERTCSFCNNLGETVVIIRKKHLLDLRNEVEDLRNYYRITKESAILDRLERDTLQRVEHMVKYLAENEGYLDESVPEDVRSILDQFEHYIAEKWQDLGSELGVSASDLANIDTIQENIKIHKVISLWTKQKGEEGSAQALVDALHRIDIDLSDLSTREQNKMVFDGKIRYLLDNLTDLFSITDSLWVRGAISIQAKERILRQTSDKSRILNLLASVENGEGNMDEFLKALRECGQDFVADELEKPDTLFDSTKRSSPSPIEGDLLSSITGTDAARREVTCPDCENMLFFENVIFDAATTASVAATEVEDVDRRDESQGQQPTRDHVKEMVGLQKEILKEMKEVNKRHLSIEERKLTLEEEKIKIVKEKLCNTDTVSVNPVILFHT